MPSTDTSFIVVKWHHFDQTQGDDSDLAGYFWIPANALSEADTINLQNLHLGDTLFNQMATDLTLLRRASTFDRNQRWRGAVYETTFVQRGRPIVDVYFYVEKFSDRISQYLEWD